MSLRIYTNVAATNSYRNLSKADNMLSKSLERLSSGLRVNRAADDAAGLGISQRMRSQISGLQTASRNASQATNLVQTAEGGMNEIHNMLTRMRELSVQAASDSVTDTDRAYLNSEFADLKSEIDRIASSTKYNGSALINGSYSGNAVSYASSATTATAALGVQNIILNGATSGTFTITDASGSTIQLTDGSTTETATLDESAVTAGSTATVNFATLGVELVINDAYADQCLNNKIITVDAGTGGVFQVGADNNANNRITFGIDNVGATTTGGLDLSSINVNSRSAAQTAIDYIDTAIDTVNTERAELGAVQNRLSYTIANVNNQAENIQASESTIRDADFALEMTAYTRNQVLVQAGTAMLAQANASPQNILTLLR